MDTDTPVKIQVLSGHKSLETAYLQPDYPYGRTLRCQRKVWIETATKGAKKGEMRFGYCTTNPKRSGEVWNKPHYSEYSPFLLMYLNPENGHIETAGVGVLSVEEIQTFKQQWYELLFIDQKAKLDEVEQQAKKLREYWSKRSAS